MIMNLNHMLFIALIYIFFITNVYGNYTESSKLELTTNIINKLIDNSIEYCFKNKGIDFFNGFEIVGNIQFDNENTLVKMYIRPKEDYRDNPKVILTKFKLDMESCFLKRMEKLIYYRYKKHIIGKFFMSLNYSTSYNTNINTNIIHSASYSPKTDSTLSMIGDLFSISDQNVSKHEINEQEILESLELRQQIGMSNNTDSFIKSQNNDSDLIDANLNSYNIENCNLVENNTNNNCVKSECFLVEENVFSNNNDTSNKELNIKENKSPNKIYGNNTFDIQSVNTYNHSNFSQNTPLASFISSTSPLNDQDNNNLLPKDNIVNLKVENKVIDSKGFLSPSNLCFPLTTEEALDAIKIQDSYFLPDILYIETTILLRRMAVRMDITRAAEESVSLILAGIGGLVLSSSRCEESVRSSIVLGELVIQGSDSSEAFTLCKELSDCLENDAFHNSILVSLKKASHYVDFVKDRNRDYMWEVMVKMIGTLGNLRGLQAYRLWMELEYMISILENTKSLHTDLPNEVMNIPEFSSNTKFPTIECTIALMRVGTKYDIRLTQIIESARACSNIMKDPISYLSIQQIRLITDTLVLARVADWFIGAFLIDKHIPPSVTKTAACLYLGTIVSPLDYSNIINFVWPRVVFALSSASGAALSHSSRSVDPELCRAALTKLLKKIGNKLSLNIDEACGKMAGCILKGRIGRVNIDGIISNIMDSHPVTISYDIGTNSASLRLATFVYINKAPLSSRKRSFSKLSAPLRATVLYSHLQSIMPGGFSINDILKMVYKFTNTGQPEGPTKKCFKYLLKAIPTFLASDDEIKMICVKAFGPWIMPDITLADIPVSVTEAHYSKTFVSN